MKKSLKIAIIAVLMVIMVVALTGCGNKLVATKTSDENGIEMKERHEIKFKGDKVDSVKMSYEFTDEASAAMMGGFMKMAFPDTEIDGKKDTININAEQFAETENLSGEDMTKETIKKQLEEEGYEVK